MFPNFIIHDFYNSFNRDAVNFAANTRSFYSIKVMLAMHVTNVMKNTGSKMKVSKFVTVIILGEL